MRIKIDDQRIHTMLFADDEIVIEEEEKDVSYMITKLIDEY